MDSTYVDKDGTDTAAVTACYSRSDMNGDTLGANDPILRERYIVLMHNFAKYMGCGANARAELFSCSDADMVSFRAQEAMSWAVAIGLINGTIDKSGNVILDAQGRATRGQIAAITQRFCEKAAK